MKEYKQKEHLTEKLFLTNEEYVRALQSLVKYCHDVVVIGPDDKFYLSERRSDGPTPGLWFVGGAVRPFISLEESLVAVVKRELGVAFTPERFVHLRQNRYWFNAKDNNGVPHDAVCEVFALRVTFEELKSMVLDSREYAGEALRSFGREELQGIQDDFFREIAMD